MNAVVRPPLWRPEDDYDFKNPAIADIFKLRARRLNEWRAEPKKLATAVAHYRHCPADFITDWGCTLDPRSASDNRPVFLPFILQPKQREMIDWIMDRWGSKESGLIEKSRDQGCSWIAMSLSITLCIFRDDMMIGFGSATEDKVDRSGDPDTLFEKGRAFLDGLPPLFRPRYSALYMRFVFPRTRSSITGQGGKNIGRGGRKSIFFIDEAAHIDHPLAVDSALSAVTDCRIDISSVSIEGRANHFSQRRHSGKVKIFTLHYRDDLRKDEAWRKKKMTELDPIVWAADYELDDMAAAEGVLIPQLWVQAAVDAHLKLGIEPTGVRRGSLDIADLGKDANCLVARHGCLLFHCESWKGQAVEDIGGTIDRAYLLADQLDLRELVGDADGLGCGARGFAKRLNITRKENRMRVIPYSEYRGSGELFDPEGKAPDTDRLNKDTFANAKAQNWWHLRRCFRETWKAVEGAKEYDADLIISIDSRIEDVQKLCSELSQPQWKQSNQGKILVDKAPEGSVSPNRGDATCQAWALRKRRGLRFSEDALNATG